MRELQRDTESNALTNDPDPLEQVFCRLNVSASSHGVHGFSRATRMHEVGRRGSHRMISRAESAHRTNATDLLSIRGWHQHLVDLLGRRKASRD